VSRQHLCHGGSADEYAVCPVPASPTSGKGLVLRAGLMKSGGLTGTAVPSAFSRRLSTAGSSYRPWRRPAAESARRGFTKTRPLSKLCLRARPTDKSRNPCMDQSVKPSE